MKSKLLVVADLGRLRAYHLQQDPSFSNPRLELVDDFETHVVQHLSAELTDQAGNRRSRGPVEGGPNLKSDGEQHNLDLERRRRAVKMVAKRISELLNDHKVDGCYLAADSRINQPILDELDQQTRAKIEKTVASNLSKLPASDLMRHFAA
jgi:hypothetical protein